MAIPSIGGGIYGYEPKDSCLALAEEAFETLLQLEALLDVCEVPKWVENMKTCSVTEFESALKRRVFDLFVFLLIPLTFDSPTKRNWPIKSNIKKRQKRSSGFAAELRFATDLFCGFRPRSLGDLCSCSDRGPTDEE